MPRPSLFICTLIPAVKLTDPLFPTLLHPSLQDPGAMAGRCNGAAAWGGPLSSVAGPLCNGVSDQRSMVVVSEAHGQQILGVLRGFRERGLLFDFNILVRDENFPCHRCVLAACSDFFRSVRNSWDYCMSEILL